MGKQVIVPLERNGQSLNLHQRKFHVTIPYVYSSAGYGFVYNMPGYGQVRDAHMCRICISLCCPCMQVCSSAYSPTVGELSYMCSCTQQHLPVDGCDTGYYWRARYGRHGVDVDGNAGSRHLGQCAARRGVARTRARQRVPPVRRRHRVRGCAPVSVHHHVFCASRGIHATSRHQRSVGSRSFPLCAT